MATHLENPTSTFSSKDHVKVARAHARQAQQSDSAEYRRSMKILRSKIKLLTIAFKNSSLKTPNDFKRFIANEGAGGPSRKAVRTRKRNAFGGMGGATSTISPTASTSSPLRLNRSKNASPKSRPATSDGRVSFHFSYKVTSRGHEEDAGKAVTHQKYLERAVAEAIAADAEATVREAYLTRTHAVERITPVEHLSSLEPRERRNGFGLIGTIGAAAEARTRFWTAVEKIEPTSRFGTVVIQHKGGIDPVLNFLAEAGIPAAKIKKTDRLISFTTTDSVHGRTTAETISNLLLAHRIMNARAFYAPGPSGRLQHRMIIELPHELSPDQRDKLVRAYAAQQLGVHGLTYFAALHNPDKNGDQRNYHVHLDFYPRPATFADGTWDFEDPTTRQNKAKFVDSPTWIPTMRQAWADLVNKALEDAGSPKRHFAESYEKAGIGLEPTVHLGPGATNMERAGITTIKGSITAAIQDRRPSVTKRYIEAKRTMWSNVFEAGFSRDEILQNMGPIHNRPRQTIQSGGLLDIVTDYVKHQSKYDSYMEERRQEQRNARNIQGTLAFRSLGLLKRLEKAQANLAKPPKNEDETLRRRLRLRNVNLEIANIIKAQIAEKADSEARFKALLDKAPLMHSHHAMANSLSSVFSATTAESETRANNRLKIKSHSISELEKAISPLPSIKERASKGPSQQGVLTTAKGLAERKAAREAAAAALLVPDRITLNATGPAVDTKPKQNVTDDYVPPIYIPDDSIPIMERPASVPSRRAAPQPPLTPKAPKAPKAPDQGPAITATLPKVPTLGAPYEATATFYSADHKRIDIAVIIPLHPADFKMPVTDAMRFVETMKERGSVPGPVATFDAEAAKAAIMRTAHREMVIRKRTTISLPEFATMHRLPINPPAHPAFVTEPYMAVFPYPPSTPPPLVRTTTEIVSAQAKAARDAAAASPVTIPDPMIQIAARRRAQGQS